MEIKELIQKAHDAALDKGFDVNKNELGTNLMLIVSELGEALEADRRNKYADFAMYDRLKNVEKDAFHTFMKDSFEDEIADTFIRLADLCGAMNIDIEYFIKEKMAYNKKRPYKHGKDY